MSSGPTTTRVVLDLDSRPATHSLFELTNPDRIVIDLTSTDVGSSLRLPEGKGRVRSVRTGTQPGGRLRVVLDLTARAESKSFLLAPEGVFGHRLVIDLTDANGTSTVTRAPAADAGGDLVVAIDAGHGGHDPGATGPNGVQEKDVVLAMARRLADYVAETPGLRPLLVRTNDRYVDHEDRVQIARDANAALFVSIHADSINDARVQGATVYVLNTRRATSETARRVADRENGGSLIGGASLAGQEEVVARTLLELLQGYALSKSYAAGEYVLGRLSRVTRLAKPDVMAGSLIVLTAPDIPSMLVETAYISNPAEEANLRDPAFQSTIAHAIHAGIVDYFRNHAPPDSYFAMNPPPEDRGPIRHVISRGETLSEIAERYRISLRVLRSTNHLSSDTIRIGQVLTIPPG